MTNIRSVELISNHLGLEEEQIRRVCYIHPCKDVVPILLRQGQYWWWYTFFFEGI